MRTRWLLRLIQEQTRYETLPLYEASSRPIVRAGRELEVVLRAPDRSLRSTAWSTTIACAVTLSCAESDNSSRAEAADGAPLPARESAEPWRVSERGVGPVRVGM